MTPEQFDDLAAKVLSRDASSAEQAELEAALAADAELRRQFDELLEARAFLRGVGEMVKAREFFPAKVPEKRLEELAGMVRGQMGPPPRGLLEKIKAFLDKLGALILPGSRTIVEVGNALSVDREPTLSVKSVWAIVVGAAAVGAIALIVITLRRPSVEIVRKSPGPKPNSVSTAEVVVATTKVQNASKLTTDLAQPQGQFLATSHLVSFMDAQPIAVYSPRNATKSLKPVILWRAEPGKKYAVRIEEITQTPAKPFQITDVTSPLDFASVSSWNRRELKNDAFYQLTIQEIGTGQTVVHTFQVLSDAAGSHPQTPAEAIDQAKLLLSGDTPCTGDALAALLALSPTDLTEQALRLKVIAFGRLGLNQEYQQAVADLNQVSGVLKQGAK